jgi:hypothetical protein
MIKQAVATVEPQDTPAVVPQAQSESNAVIAMIERAARDPNVDIDKMQRLLDMRANETARQAKAAYAAALAEMQPKLPVIGRRGQIKIGQDASKNPKYALWEDINDAIKPVLAAHGFALSFRTGRDGDRVTVTGILSHRDGHSEETTMVLPIDTGPGRNAVQSIGSSTSYGKRYTATALLNLTSRGEDDDGEAGGAEPITDKQSEELKTLIVQVGADIQKFLKVFKIDRVEDLPAKRFEEAKTRLEQFGKQAK